MYLDMNEQEQEHVFVCLQEGKKKYAKVKKDLEGLDQPTDRIDYELEINAQLRRKLNPRAEEEAREKTRKHDPAQLDIEAEARRSGPKEKPLNETDGIPVVRPSEPIDVDALHQLLAEADCFVRTDDIAGWTPDQQAAAQDFARRGGAKGVPEGEGWPGETPAFLSAIALREHEVDALIEAGPYRVVEETRESDGLEFVYFAVGRDIEGGDYERDSTYSNDLDADVRAARLNRGLQPVPTLAEEKLTQLEPMLGGDESDLPAAATDDDDDQLWETEPPAAVTDDAQQAIKAAAEGGE